MRALEFYSGLGGMHHALLLAAPYASVVQAFEISDIANDVYEHNHGFRPWQGNIEAVPRDLLEQADAQLWMLAPPCQPYTRRGLQQDADDVRARSFLKLIDWIADMQAQPEYILVENVVGFEDSRTAQALRSMLRCAGYAVQEFLLSPLQLGIPYSRPRYFCIARKLRADGSGAFPIADQPDGRPFTEPPEQLLTRPAATEPAIAQSEPQATAATASPAAHEASAGVLCSPDTDTELSVDVAPLSKFLTSDPSSEGPFPEEARNLVRRSGQGTGADFVPANPSLAERGNAICSAVDAVPACCNQTERGGDVGTRSTSSCRCHVHQEQEQADFDDESNALSVVVDQGGHDSELTAVAAHGPRNTDAACGRSAESDNPWRPFWLPDAEISARGAVMDIVTAEHQRCNCFTKTYSRYSKGSGSVLATRNLHVLRRLVAADVVRAAAALKPHGGTLMAPGDLRAAMAVPLEIRQQLTASAKGQSEPPLPPPTAGELTVDLRQLGLRYFTPGEVAALHSFPASFSFPAHVTLRQRYALLGNSLSASVVAALLRYLLHGDSTCDTLSFGPL